MKSNHENEFQNQTDTYNKSRRTFLKYFLAGSAVLALETSGIGRLTSMVTKAEAASKVTPYIPSQTPGNGFPQTIASGDPTPTGMMLWTRVEPSLETGFTNQEIDSDVVYWMEEQRSKNDASLVDAIEQGKFVMFEVSKKEDFSSTEITGFTPIWKDHDNVVRVDLDGTLQPAQTYYYRFLTKSGLVSKTGRCRTLPDADSDIASAKIGYVSCQDYTNGYFNALGHMAAEEMDFFLHVGDYIYESVGDAVYQGGLEDRQISLPSGKAKAFTLEDYRMLYKTYRTDKDLQKLHEKHGMVATWDDHEFANDTYHPAVAPDDSLESNPQRRLFANQVWFEFMPARVPYDGSKSFEESIKIYRSIILGKLASIYMTDERLYRSSHPCGEGELDRYVTDGCPNMNSSDRTMLGSTQKDWFLSELKQSRSTWKLWGNEVQNTQLKFLNKFMNLDAWDGFTYERDAIAQTVIKEGIENFIALTGDFHTFEASYLQSEYSDSGETYGVELMVGSVTSSNLRETLRNSLNDVPAPSSPIASEGTEKMIQLLRGKLGTASTVTAEILFKELQNIVKVENPWIQLFDSTTHGYAVLELSKSKAKWTAYSVDNIEKPSASKELLWQCEIPNGEASINVTEDNSTVNV
ncbi:alkaline phosphatase D [Thalassobacillus cyri]|uniref:Alkaline phosphatase D n=1 Tax=Thalassobacillus cyri TaxID=571932 RepID=A0A1H3WFI1_9BACI|nr:alkaline phosphatase D family protein [Thalassobacillus cyri]SDZ84988.1 alkaline phosphatase D [Thalassobacillus cyri]